VQITHRQLCHLLAVADHAMFARDAAAAGVSRPSFSQQTRYSPTAPQVVHQQGTTSATRDRDREQLL
jgi:hypothetical protein